MKMKAAVAYESGKPLVVEEVELEAPREGEVIVKNIATGLCHTDISAAQGRAAFPIVLGHEGAGIVHEVGPGVSSVKPGDHVVLCGAVGCGKCRFCIHGDQVMCETFRPFYFNGFLPGRQTRLRSKKGEVLHHFFLQSSFAEYSLVPEQVAVKVRDDAPLDAVCVLGCGALTGLGAVINNMRPEPGTSIAVFGCGGVGLSGIMGARLAGCGMIIAVDVLDSKLQMAKELGATHVINPLREKPVEVIKAMLPGVHGGVDYAFCAVGAEGVFTQAFDSLRFGGKVVLVTAPPSGIKVEVSSLLKEKKVCGCSMGSGRATLDIPMYVDLFMQGRLPINKLVTHRFPLADINKAFEAQEKGGAIKPVIMFDGLRMTRSGGY